MITQYIRPALLVIAGAIAITTAQSLWNGDRNRAVLLAIVGGVCLVVAVMRIKSVRR
jgi:drug/metabolite transporter (DMT)-like permease